MKPMLFLGLLLAMTCVSCNSNDQAHDQGLKNPSTQLLESQEIKIAKEELENPSAQLPESRVIEIAKKELAKRLDTVPKSLEVDASKQQDGWMVTFTRQPAVPGGHYLVEISNDGKVIAFHRGK